MPLTRLYTIRNTAVTASVLMEPASTTLAYAKTSLIIVSMFPTPSVVGIKFGKASVRKWLMWVVAVTDVACHHHLAFGRRYNGHVSRRNHVDYEKLFWSKNADLVRF